jgi:hypothetical protein
VKNRFQDLPFKCNLQRYITGTVGGAAILFSGLGGALHVEVS